MTGRSLQLDLLKRRRDQSEFRLHCVVADFLRLAAHPDLLWLHPANGEKRSPVTGSRLKRMGVVAGAADLHLTLPGGRSAWLEIKAEKGRLSFEQREFQARCERAGAHYAVAHSLDEAREILTRWGALRERRGLQ